MTDSDYMIRVLANIGSWKNLSCRVKRRPNSSVGLHVKQGSFVGHSEEGQKELTIFPLSKSAILVFSRDLYILLPSRTRLLNKGST